MMGRGVPWKTLQETGGQSAAASAFPWGPSPRPALALLMRGDPGPWPVHLAAAGHPRPLYTKLQVVLAQLGCSGSLLASHTHPAEQRRINHLK